MVGSVWALGFCLEIDTGRTSPPTTPSGAIITPFRERQFIAPGPVLAAPLPRPPDLLLNGSGPQRGREPPEGRADHDELSDILQREHAHQSALPGDGDKGAAGLLHAVEDDGERGRLV